MASNVRCLIFLLLALSFSLQTHARDSKFFNKVTKNTKVNKETVSLSKIQAPTPSPEPEPEFKPQVEHGYGLYGKEPYEFPPTTTKNTKTPQFHEEFSNSKEFNKAYSNNNFNGNGYVTEKQGMSDTRFLENGKYFYDVSQDEVNKDESSFLNKDETRGNWYGNGNQEKQGMSDTRFLENGKHFYDVNNEKEGNSYFNTNNNENENEYEKLQGEKQGMSDTRYLENGKYFYGVNNEREGNALFNTNNNEYENGNGNENKNFQAEKQGMSDTRFMENGKYFHDVNNEKEDNEDGNLDEFDDKNNEEGKLDEFDEVNNNKNENGIFGVEKQGMSDTRFLENGKYYYDINNEKENNNFNYNPNNNHGNGDVGFHNNDNNVEYAKNKYNGNGNNEYETQGRGGYNYQHNEYHAKEGKVGGYNYPNKFPKYEFDTMEEYDRQQGYVDGNDHYVP